MAAQAAELLQELMNNDEVPISLRAKIAMDNLDRTGYARQVNVSGNLTHTHLSAQDIEDLKQRALAGRAAKVEQKTEVIDVEFKKLN
jgi:hypothetical protein